MEAVIFRQGSSDSSIATGPAAAGHWCYQIQLSLILQVSKMGHHAFKAMTDRDAFIRTICESPDDDAPRLVFADWLEEHGDQEWARFIRMRPPEVKMDTFNLGAALTMCRVKIAGINVLSYFGQVNPPQATIRHGFISRIRLPLAAFMEHARELFQAAPITEVELSDRDCEHHEHDPGWWRSVLNDPAEPDELPGELFDLLTGGTFMNRWRLYGESALARADLSAACVRFGRELAGLPELARV